MKMKSLVLSVLMLAPFSFAQAQAQGSNGDVDPRKGFFFGVGVGGGVEAKVLKKFGLTWTGKIGAGLSDQLVLHYFNVGYLSSKQSVSYIIGNHLFGVTYFFNPSGSSAFVTGGIGMSSQLEYYGNAYAIEDQTKVGFGAAAGGGYEWRVGRRFAIQAEGIVSFTKPSSRKAGIVIGANSNFLWYF